MSASFVLLIKSPDGSTQTRELSSACVSIGREVGDLVVADPGCSSKHAEISFDGANVKIRDLGSTNGTWCNGQMITEAAWQTGMTIQIGQHHLTLQQVKPLEQGLGGTVVMRPLAGAGASPEQRLALGSAPTDLAPRVGQAAAVPQGSQAAPATASAEKGGSPPAAGSPAFDASGRALQVAPASKSRVNPIWFLVPVFLLVTCGVGGAGAYYYFKRSGDSKGVATAVGDTAPASALAEAKEVTVNFVWFAGKPGPDAKGGTAPARIRVGPNKSGTVSVGVAEEFAGGGGNQWRTATWLAAFNATRTMGASLADYEFNVHVGGHTDGPSAGMLTTVAMLAVMKGAPLREDSTMTGTINPDGSAGPVGGIVQKMEGAKEKGLKRFGFPIGTRNHKDMKTGKDVDLVAEAQRFGLEAVEVSDLYQGYEFMTGAKLDRPEAIAESELELDPKTQALLRAKLMGWKARVERELGTFKEEVKRSAVAAQAAGGLLQVANDAFEKAQRYERNSYLVPALHSYAETAITIAAASRMAHAVGYLTRRDMESLLQLLQTAQNVKPEVEAFGNQLEVKAQVKTLGGQLSAAAAYASYVTARSATMIADDFLASAVELLQQIENGKAPKNAQTLETLMTRVTVPTLYYGIASVFLDYAKDVQDLIADQGEVQPISAEQVDRIVAGYASAAAAVLAYFDALIVDEIATTNKVSPDEARFFIAQREPEYYLARKANILSEYSTSPVAKEKDEKPSDGAKLMRLAAASSAYLGGAKLVNKWYSLNGHFDQAGELVLENRRALTGQLDLARRNARQAAAAAKGSAGFVPVPAQLAFQAANAQREGNDEDKLAALAAYWESAFWSELAATPK